MLFYYTKFNYIIIYFGEKLKNYSVWFINIPSNAELYKVCKYQKTKK
ncbi:hypothetical protein [Plasmodium yoelii yoelii]|uniref:Uncharacterized protein n=1 Tax=Plasmodium yoelii yoelii TaxID=73239 RepID=Q7RM55_PLAYO|nr:hypothetical protein [Plasmodium yoelii yoelii]